MLAGRQIVIILVTWSHSREYTGAIKWEIFNKSAESHTVTWRNRGRSGWGQRLGVEKLDILWCKHAYRIGFKNCCPLWKRELIPKNTVRFVLSRNSGSHPLFPVVWNHQLWFWDGKEQVGVGWIFSPRKCSIMPWACLNLYNLKESWNFGLEWLNLRFGYFALFSHEPSRGRIIF